MAARTDNITSAAPLARRVDLRRYRDLSLVPVLLVKLWSVLPKLFEWPPLRSPAHALERLSLFLLVGGAVFEFTLPLLGEDARTAVRAAG